MSLSVLGCVVNGPGEARETDIGITGGGNGKHMVYLSGVTDHHVQDADMIEHIVKLVEAKAAEIEAADEAAQALAAAVIRRSAGIDRAGSRLRLTIHVEGARPVHVCRGDRWGRNGLTMIGHGRRGIVQRALRSHSRFLLAFTSHRMSRTRFAYAA